MGMCPSRWPNWGFLFLARWAGDSRQKNKLGRTWHCVCLLGKNSVSRVLAGLSQTSTIFLKCFWLFRSLSHSPLTGRSLGFLQLSEISPELFLTWSRNNAAEKVCIRDVLMTSYKINQSCKLQGMQWRLQKKKSNLKSKQSIYDLMMTFHLKTYK